MIRVQSGKTTLPQQNLQLQHCPNHHLSASGNIQNSKMYESYRFSVSQCRLICSVLHMKYPLQLHAEEAKKPYN